MQNWRRPLLPIAIHALPGNTQILEIGVAIQIARIPCILPRCKEGVREEIESAQIGDVHRPGISVISEAPLLWISTSCMKSAGPSEFSPILDFQVGATGPNQSGCPRM